MHHHYINMNISTANWSDVLGQLVESLGIVGRMQSERGGGWLESGGNPNAMYMTMDPANGNAGSSKKFLAIWQISSQQLFLNTLACTEHLWVQADIHWAMNNFYFWLQWPSLASGTNV